MGLVGLCLLGVAYTGWGGLYGLEVFLFVIVSCVGFTLPNATAGALQPHGQQAGSASALLGTLTYSCATIAALSVSALANGTGLSMAAVIAVCGIAAWVIYRWLVGEQPESTATALAT